MGRSDHQPRVASASQPHTTHKPNRRTSQAHTPRSPPRLGCLGRPRSGQAGTGWVQSTRVRSSGQQGRCCLSRRWHSSRPMASAWWLPVGSSIQRCTCRWAYPTSPHSRSRHGRHQARRSRLGSTRPPGTGCPTHRQEAGCCWRPQCSRSRLCSCHRARGWPSPRRTDPAGTRCTGLRAADSRRRCRCQGDTRTAYRTPCRAGSSGQAGTRRWQSWCSAAGRRTRPGTCCTRHPHP